jgi:hypothetical protein
MIMEKKRFIAICSHSLGSDIESLSYSDLAKILCLSQDDVEEWAITAINHGILDGRID